MYKYLTKTKIIEKKIIYLSSCPSTNDIAAAWLANHPAERAISVVTDYQEKGRGQQGNRWESDRGKNALFSVAWKPEQLDAGKGFYLNMAVTVALLNALASFGAQAKWPNDILVNRRKVAGILIETTVSGKNIEQAIMGIGININQENFESAHAISLKQLAGENLDKEQIVHQVLKELDIQLKLLKSSRWEAIRKNYLKHLYGLNEPLPYVSQGNSFTGITRGVDEHGRLQIEINGEVQTFMFKEVSFLL